MFANHRFFKLKLDNISEQYHTNCVLSPFDYGAVAVYSVEASTNNPESQFSSPWYNAAQQIIAVTKMQNKQTIHIIHSQANECKKKSTVNDWNWNRENSLKLNDGNGPSSFTQSNTVHNFACVKCFALCSGHVYRVMDWWQCTVYTWG